MRKTILLSALVVSTLVFPGSLLSMNRYVLKHIGLPIPKPSLGKLLSNIHFHLEQLQEESHNKPPQVPDEILNKIIEICRKNKLSPFQAIVKCYPSADLLDIIFQDENAKKKLNFEKDDPLMWAFYYNDKILVAKLLENRKKIKNGFTNNLTVNKDPTSQAYLLNQETLGNDFHLEARDFICTPGQGQDIFLKGINTKNIVEQTPLITACLPGHPLTFPPYFTPFLYDSDPQSSDLRYADVMTGFNRKDMIINGFLLSGVEINIQDIWGNTALHYALYNHEFIKVEYDSIKKDDYRKRLSRLELSMKKISEIIKRILQTKKANLLLENKKGESILSLLLKYENETLLKKLEEDEVCKKVIDGAKAQRAIQKIGPSLNCVRKTRKFANLEIICNV